MYACNSSTPTANKMLSTTDTIPVKLATITSSTGYNSIEASGIITTENMARLSFKVGGVIDRIYVAEGALVKKGQLLASLKNTEINVQVNQLQYALDKAQRDYNRALHLYQDSVATLEQLQNAQTALAIAKENLQLGKFNQTYANIYAPQNGFVAKKLLNEGELAGPGTPVLVLGSTSGNSKWILALGVSDKVWAALQLNNKAQVRLDAYPNKIFEGKVSKKSLAADPVSGSFQVEVSIDFDGYKPAIGMYAKASITATTPSVGYQIPYDALIEANADSGYVFVTNNQLHVQKVLVQIEQMNNQYVQIKKGLEGYKYVVIAGSAYLNEQSVIKIIP